MEASDGICAFLRMFCSRTALESLDMISTANVLSALSKLIDKCVEAHSSNSTGVQQRLCLLSACEALIEALPQKSHANTDADQTWPTLQVALRSMIKLHALPVQC